MVWAIVGIPLSAVYAVLTLHLAALGAAMGASKKPRTVWRVLAMWLILLAAPAWSPAVWPINRLGCRVPILGAPFSLGGRRRRTAAGAGRRPGGQ